MYGPRDVNRKNSRTWVKINEDSRKERHRSEFIEEYGGEFVDAGRRGYVTWQEKKGREKRALVFLDPDGNEVEIVNVEKFCRENNLIKSALYAVMAGDRKHHKKYTFLEQRIIHISGPKIGGDPDNNNRVH